VFGLPDVLFFPLFPSLVLYSIKLGKMDSAAVDGRRSLHPELGRYVRKVGQATPTTPLPLL